MNFDLTTTTGRKEVVDAFDKFGWAIAPQIWLLKKALDFFSVSETIKEQQEVAINLIKAGKENGVDEMRITMDQKAGIDLQSKIEGIPLKIKIGKEGHCIVEVKYKS
jgi:hypothetical protein